MHGVVWGFLPNGCLVLGWLKTLTTCQESRMTAALYKGGLWSRCDVCLGVVDQVDAMVHTACFCLGVPAFFGGRQQSLMGVGAPMIAIQETG